MGDFNSGVLELPETVLWRSLGWQEIQLHALALHHKPVEATCKSTTVRDYVWCSPELLSFWIGTQLLHHVYPDHAVLFGQFRFPAERVDTWHWITPKPLPWVDVAVHEWQQSLESTWTPFPWTSDTTCSFRQWSETVEHTVAEHVKAPDGLPPGVRGRGATLKVSKGPLMQPRVKPSRAGEVTLSMPFPNSTLLKWFKQLRRLQSLLRSCRNGGGSVAADTYQALCWSAIIRSSGFKPSFRSWWLRRPVRLQNSVPALDGLPTLEQLQLIYEDFHLNFRRYESWYGRQQAKMAQLQKESCHRTLFRTLKPEGAEPLDFLTSATSYSLCEVDISTGAVSIEGHADFTQGQWTLCGEKVVPVPVLDAPSSVTSRLWCSFESDILPVPGQQLVQTTPLVQPSAIHDELLSLWLPRWQALSQAPDPAWTRITDFVQAYIPSASLVPSTLTATRLRKAFSSGRGLRTGGPDGWRREDITHMPDVVLEDVVSLYEHIESGWEWPEQLIRGHVTCLQKKPDNFALNNFRPIVLYSLWYRLWGVLTARHYLQQLEQLAGFPAFGFLAGRGCSDITFAIQCTLEAGLCVGHRYCGALFDLEKCFNNIPRAPILLLARWLGISSGTVTAWISFLTGMRRAFVVNGNLSDAVTSDTGLPEGDAMSCVGMVLLDWAYHCYLRHFHPRICELSYVDNLEIVGGDTGSVLAASVTVSAWADLFRMTIDPAKTVYWALDPSDRRELVSLGLSVSVAGLDLGAAMMYSAQHRNSALTTRIKSVLPLWKRLRLLHVSTYHKTMAIRVAILPRALHGCMNVVLGFHWMLKIRTQIMKALGFDRPGANPVLRIAFCCSLDIEPSFYVAWNCIRSFVGNVQRNSWIQQCWKTFFANRDSKRTYGPFANFLTTLHTLGWTLLDEDTITMGAGLVISLSNVDLTLLKMLVVHFWRRQLVRSVAHRVDFAGLDGINMSASFQSRQHLDCRQKELLNCIRDGTMSTNSFKSKFDPSITALCGCGLDFDSVEHRALHCPRFASVRRAFADVVDMWHFLPPCVSHHGLMPENPYLQKFWALLEDLPRTFDWMLPPVTGEVQYIFTDGSCNFPTVPSQSLASWSVVSMQQGLPVASGLLPGLKQTINRAELWACIAACHWLIHFQCEGVLFIDSAYTCDGANFLLEHMFVPTDWDNRDLWNRLLECLQLALAVSFRKVRAHMDEAQLTDPMAQALTEFNGLVDTNAKIALQTFGNHTLRTTHRSLVNVNNWHRFWADRCQRFLLSLADESFQSLRDDDVNLNDEEDEFVLPSPTFCTNHQDWVDCFPIDLHSSLATNVQLQQFGLATAFSFAQWLLDLTFSAQVLIPITFLEFFIGYDTMIGGVLPVAVGSHNSLTRWVSGESMILSRSLASHLKSFQFLFDTVSEHLSLDTPRSTLSKPEIGILKELPGLTVPWPNLLHERVQNKVASYFGGLPLRFARDLTRSWP